MLANGMMDGSLNPFILNHSPVLPGPGELEVERGFHGVEVAECGRVNARATRTLVLKRFDLHVMPYASG